MHYDATTIEPLLWYTVPAAGLGREKFLLKIREAKEYEFAGVCVPACSIGDAAELLHPSGLPVCAAISSPLAGQSSAVKLRCCGDAIAAGADVLQIALNPALENLQAAGEDLLPCVELAQQAGKRVSVILFAALLGDRLPDAAALLKSMQIDSVILDPVYGTVSTPELVRKTTKLLPEVSLIASGAATAQTAADLLDAGAGGILSDKPFHILTGFEADEERVCMCK